MNKNLNVWRIKCVCTHKFYPFSSPVKVFPAAPVPQHSTLRLIANVTPDFAFAKVSWAGPGGIPLMSKKTSKTDTVAKVPQVLSNDGGAYVCMVYPRGNSSSPLFAFNVDVAVAGKADWKKRSNAEALPTRMHLLLLFIDGASGHQCQRL